LATTKLPAMSSARALCGIARSRERRRRVTLQPFRETQRLVLTRSRTSPLTSRRANSGAGRGGNSPADSGCYGRQRSKRRAPLHAARASDKSPPPGRCATIIRASRTRPLSRAHAHCQLDARARDHRVVQQVGERVAFPPKSDTGYARENKIDDVRAVLRYGVVSTSELREHGRDDAVPRVVE
jgi:hypothetical protein